MKDCGRWLIVPAMLGGAALLADGVLTPAVTVTTAVEGLRSIESMNRFLGPGQWKIVIITLLIITGLFSVQHAGTSKIGKAFGPVMFLWFSFLGLTGAMHIISLPGVLRAFNPVYALQVLFSPNNKLGFMILGSVFLATTGAAAAIIASQALITGSYTLVSEAILLALLPHLEIRYPADTKGQLYIGAVNSVLWIGCSLVVLYFRSGARMEAAYGLAITITMLMTTLLISVYLHRIRKKSLLALLLLIFTAIEGVLQNALLGLKSQKNISI